MSVERIRKLLALTVANGCTEAEAMAAAEKAAKLMAELGLEAADFSFDAKTITVRMGWQSVRSRLWATIASYTNCAVTFLGGGEVEYVGREPWPEVARYLHEVTNRAIDRELRTFKATKWYKRRSSLRARRAAAFDFTEAMVIRLQRKMANLFDGTYSIAAGKQAIAERDRRHSDLKTVPVTPRRGKLPRYDRAGIAGMEAGSGVTLSHGVDRAGDAPLLIEGGQ